MLGSENGPESPPPVHAGPGNASTPQPKPTSEMSEYKFTLIGMALGVILILCGHEEIGGVLLATVIPGYALSRGKAKSGQ